ncbi:hypothetical protein PRIPAC_85381 [Pristionchus pacificus]|uniref:PDZ domain-containing protein n=1 Tax=Pristionchus pacificus TaxID=54126 RepID=A0A2A6BLX8_PRIPA|nr:hypothetical protein PRIPAC_85381 [Pristionchus pacificus]|eukprot:PDM66942.1 PDZ domain-containing protein [Pristionchus pacificus]
MSCGRSGGSLMGGNDDPPGTFVKDDSSYMDGREKKPIPVPTALIETISFRVCTKQRLGFNIRQRDNRVMRIHWSSPLHNKMCVGDKILKMDDVAFDTKAHLRAVTPHKSISCSSESIEEGHAPVIMKITIERAVYSWSRLEMTTLEQFELQNNKKIFTGRPLKRYTVRALTTVVLRRPRLPGLEMAPIGISLRYDSTERVTVAAVAAGSLGSAHLRPWDIIKRVNGDEVRSKTMCAFMMVRSLKDSGQVVLDVEVLKKCSSRDTMEMPVDVVNICANQISVIKSGTLKPPRPIIIVRPFHVNPKKDAATSPISSTSTGKSAKEKRLTHADKPRTEEIVSDVEEGLDVQSLIFDL